MNIVLWHGIISSNGAIENLFMNNTLFIDQDNFDWSLSETTVIDNHLILIGLHVKIVW